ncbi:MAG: DNA polymerase III subunit delta' [Candidatus Omnitrophica bacterium]|nr:DNA polymerase III subunit delta' [Candidatus Omnitrophota bacterium]
MSFKDILGQNAPIRILQAYISEGRLAGGYLFTGPRGIGKKLVALTLAKALNCLEGAIDSCDQCASCRKVDSATHPDVQVIETLENETEIKIEYIRQLKSRICLRPYEGKKKVFIINDAHKLNPESSNALLKVLEEPPKDSLIILVTDKPALLFKTIISRCKTVRFMPQRRQELEKALNEDFGFDRPESHYLSFFYEGRLADALKMKGKDVLKEKNRLIDNFVLKRSGGFSYSSAPDRDTLREDLNILAGYFRDIYLLKIGMPHAELINLDRRSELLRVMAVYSFSQLNEILSLISSSLDFLEHNVNAKLLMHNLSLAIGQRQI